MTELRHVTLLPWLLLKEGVSVPGFELVSYRRGSPLVGTGSKLSDALDDALSCYVGPDLEPIGQTTLLRYSNRELICSLSDGEKQEILEFSELLATAGLSARELCSHFSYWNRDHFRVTFEVLTGANGFVTVSSRRRDGVHLDMGSRDRAHVCRPNHVRTATVSLDIPLLESLVRSQSSDHWPRVLESLVNFNAANTDSGYAAERVELVLLCGAMERLLDYPFPGNVRELENIIERAIALSRDSMIDVDALPPALLAPPRGSGAATRIPPGGVDLESLVNDYERKMLQEALAASGGVKKRAAKLLGISFRSFRYRLEKLNLDEPSDNEA